MSKQELLDALRSIRDHLTVLQRWASDCEKNVQAGTLANLELIKDTDKGLARIAGALRD